jgi:ribosomal protein L24
MCYRIETIKGHKVRRLLPAITELVFVHATSKAINDFKIHSKETIYWLTKPLGEHREKITVPDKAMEDFIRITQQNEQAVTYFQPDELSLHKGDHIIIHSGPFDGVEGTLLKIKGKREKQIIVSIPNIVSAAVSIKPEMVELISKKTAKSTDSARDSKELIRLATQMITSPPNRIEQATEYNLLYQEIRRLYESLKPLHGYLLTQEGELSLSLLMAEIIVLPTISSETQDRFRKALSALGNTTLMAVRMQFIGGIILSDETLANQARKMLIQWQSEGPTDRQRAIISETSLFKICGNFR